MYNKILSIPAFYFEKCEFKISGAHQSVTLLLNKAYVSNWIENYFTRKNTSKIWNKTFLLSSTVEQNTFRKLAEYVHTPRIFQLDHLKNQATHEKILFHIFDLFFLVEYLLLLSLVLEHVIHKAFRQKGSKIMKIYITYKKN